MTTPRQESTLVRRHIALGFGGLCLMATVGLFLEGLHAFKVDGYLDPEHETRRLLLSLGHAHGALLALVQLGFAFSVKQLGRAPRGSSALLIGALLLLPLGFFSGGLGESGSDPSAGILLVPLGALCLVIATAQVALLALGKGRQRSADE